MTTTPSLSLSSNDGLAKDEEEPLDIFSMPIPDAALISRQETDKEPNLTTKPSIPSIPSIGNSTNIYSNNPNPINNNINDSDDDSPCAIPPLSTGLLTRQITDDTPHSKTTRGNTDTDDQKITLTPFKLSRQKTDDTPHAKNQSNITAFTVPNNENESMNVPPLLSRQLTDDTPHAKNQSESTDTNSTAFNIPSNVNDNNTIQIPLDEFEKLVDNNDENDSMNMPPLLSRQLTDDTPHAKNIPSNENDNNTVQIPLDEFEKLLDRDIENKNSHENNIQETLFNEFNLPPMNITRQTTDDAKDITENDNNNALDLGDEFNLPPMNITRQTTDDAKPISKPDIEKQITDTVQSVSSMNEMDSFDLPPMNITRQTTDDAKPVQQPDTMQHEMDSFNLPPMNITRQTTDNAKPVSKPYIEKQITDTVQHVNNNEMDMQFDLPPLNITRQLTDDAKREHDELNDDLLLTPLIRQTTDATDKEYDNHQIELHDNIDNNNEFIADDITIPKLDIISRQTTDMTANDDDIEDVNLNSLMKEIPSRVSTNNVDVQPKISDNLNNKYLDTDLLLFDDNGKLIDNNNENTDENNVEEIEDDSINQFIEHKQPIYCMGFNPRPEKQYEIITGGQDEVSYIWNIINYDSTIAGDEQKQTSNYYKLEGYHTDTIIDCGYNITGKFIATASMDSTIKIFNCNKGYKLQSEFDIGNEISYLKWHPNNNKNNRNILMVGSLDKNVWLYKYNKNETGQQKQFENIQILSGHSSKIECGGWTKYNGGINAYSADSDGMIIIWENIVNDIPFNGKKKYVFKPNKNLSTIYHQSGVNVMDDCIAAPLLVSGSCDYSVCLINYENGKILQKLGQHNDSVEWVKFNKLYNIYNYVSSSSLDGYINIWDLNNGKMRNRLKHNSGVIVHEWFNNENNANLMVSGCMNGMVQVWDSRSGKVIREFKGHRKDNTIQTIKITQDDKYIVSGCDDSSVRVWKFD